MSTREEIKTKVIEMRNGGHPVETTCKTLMISRATYYVFIKESGIKVDKNNRLNISTLANSKNVEVKNQNEPDEKIIIEKKEIKRNKPKKEIKLKIKQKEGGENKIDLLSFDDLMKQHKRNGGEEKLKKEIEKRIN